MKRVSALLLAAALLAGRGWKTLTTYDEAHDWGDGAHSDAHGSAILPDVLRWLWPREAAD